MRRVGCFDLPLHTGKAPRWLFNRMVVLGKFICEAIIVEFGSEYLLKQLSRPFWFQSLGCVLGFDWHSSGLTTTVCGALKEGLKDLSLDYGIYFCGGKGAASRKTPREIEDIGQKIAKDTDKLVYTSKIVAKVDNNALQDSFTLYHHTFIFTKNLKWAVIQQGMSEGGGGWSRRYHWHYDGVSSFIKSPHKGIVSNKSFLTMNLIDINQESLQSLITELSGRNKNENLKEIISLKETAARLPRRHQVLLDDVNPKYLEKIFLKTYESKAKDFESLLALEGVGSKTLRALALISDLIYSKPVSFRDPARFSFAHGGKDGYPYKINVDDYDKTIDVLRKAINKAKIDRTDKIKALRRLYRKGQGARNIKTSLSRGWARPIPLIERNKG
jgi:hypothetical protein